MTMPLVIQSVRRNDIELLRRQIAKGANVEVTGGTGKTTLHWAVWEGRAEFVELLLECGADVFAVTSTGCNALELAVLGADSAIVETLLASGTFEPKPLVGYYAMCCSAERGYLEISKMLYSYGFPVAFPENDFEGRTPLHWAVQGGNSDVVSWLLANGARVSQYDEEGFAPLMQASSEGFLEIVRILIEYGADVNMTNPHTGDSALHSACAWGHRDIAMMLIDHGADVGKKNHEGAIPDLAVLSQVGT